MFVAPFRTKCARYLQHTICMKMFHRVMIYIKHASERCRKRSNVMIPSFRTDMPGQTVEQSDQGLHCSPFRLHRLDSLLYGRAT